MFNAHHNKTSNGITIVVGLKVLDYDYKEGVVVSDDYDKEYMCFAQCKEHHKRDNDLVEATGKSVHLCPSPCNHDHWFTIETANGTKSFNGSRLKAL